MKFGQVVEKNITNKMLESLFLFLSFLARFTGFCQKIGKFPSKFRQKPANQAKNGENQKKNSNILFGLFFSTIWPNFMFLALMHL